MQKQYFAEHLLMAVSNYINLYKIKLGEWNYLLFNTKQFHSAWPLIQAYIDLDL